MTDIEELLGIEAEASERNKDAEPGPGTRTTRGNGRAKILQIRLNPEELAALREAAERRGLPVSTVARDMILRGLVSGSDFPGSVIARMRADLETLAAVTRGSESRTAL